MIRFVVKDVRVYVLWLFVLVTGVVSPTHAQRQVPGAGENSADWVDVEVVPSHESVPAGSSMQIGFQLHVEEGWFVHSHTPAYSLFTPVRLMVEEVPGVTVSNMRYPEGIECAVSYAERPFNIYEDTFYVVADFEFNEQLAPRELNLQMMLNYQACDQELCIPPAGEVFRVPVTILPPNEEPVPLNVERVAEMTNALDSAGSGQGWRPWVVLAILLVVGWMVGVRIRRKSGDAES